ncbi:MAG: mechanosensitive ion channel family protein [Pseudomonadota bacterium]
MGKKRDRDSLGNVGGSLVRYALIIIGFMLAITTVAPSISPGDLIAGLGVSSVAIGFAFKDILQNMLAGILILLRQPFEVGDQIISGGHEGTVEKIETRATFIKTYDGRRVVIPNSDIYTDAVTVNTAFKHIRSQYDVGVGCNDDWDEAKDVILKAVAKVEGVTSDPEPECIPIAIADFSNNIRVRWWTASDRASVIHTFGRVIEQVYKDLDAAGIDMPYPTNVMLFHDQTEEHDGMRSKQREGWPARPGEDDPRTARMVDGMKSKQAKDRTNGAQSNRETATA